MQEPKHSPAPWKTEFLGIEWGGVLDKNFQLVATIKEFPTYECPNVELVDSKLMGDANIRLILNSPEMLQALITTSGNLASLAAACNCNDYDAWKKMIDNVIAKAMGEE
ncbi:MAG: hypothetical protein KGI54_18415 [Pseudomonadota bacterium]|nr:hypothetical protein [Pseudomonadota bacterium]